MLLALALLLKLEAVGRAGLKKWGAERGSGRGSEGAGAVGVREAANQPPHRPRPGWSKIGFSQSGAVYSKAGVEAVGPVDV